MKTALMFILTSLLMNAAQANSEITQKTLVTCEQTDGDQWIEIGVTTYTKGSYRLAVVLHNDDDGSAKLQQEIIVTLVENTSSKISLTDNFETTKLMVNKYEKTAQFYLLKDGPDSIQDERMSCELDSTITWNIQANPQPRISVGN